MKLTKETVSDIVGSVSRRREMMHGYIPSAILMLFFNRGDQTRLVYIRKTSGPHQHGGQMAFPGGKIEPPDKSSRDAAIRETYEEIGVPASAYEYVGELGHFETFTSRYDAAAHAAWAPGPPTYRRDPFEVQRIIEIPLGVLYAQFRPDINQDDYQEMMWLNFKYRPDGKDEVINLWGLTARITHHFVQGLHEHLARRKSAIMKS